MNNRLSLLFIAMICVLSGCAKNEVTTTNDENRDYINAWIQTNYPNTKPQGLGIYVIKENKGLGEKYNGEKFLFVDYQKSTLDGNITETTNKRVAQQIGSYEESSYYGTRVWERNKTSMVAGVEDMLNNLFMGTSKTALIPSWLNVNERYKNASEYYNHKFDKNQQQNNAVPDNIIYTIKLRGFTNDIDKWETDSLARYSQKYLNGIDSLSYGFYFIRHSKSIKKVIHSDSIVFINYIGRRLDGSVFKTNIADTAKMYNIYNPEMDYSPMQILWGKNADNIFIIDNGTKSRPIKGFRETLWNMGYNDYATGIFISKLGYGETGLGYSIPPYCPIRYDIFIIK